MLPDLPDVPRIVDSTGALEFDETQTAAIRAVCDRLDRLPLAIELAAARARTMTPTEIEARLDEQERSLRHVLSMMIDFFEDSASRDAADLEDIAHIGRTAGERAVRRLSPGAPGR